MSIAPFSGSFESRKRLRTELARRGEDLAASYLESAGFELIARNHRIGRDEIDIIARRGQLLIFCEVRSRSANQWISPAQTVTSRKIANIRRGAMAFVRQNSLKHMELRMDVASVIDHAGRLELNYLEAAI